jgi:acyl-CoA thioesterase-2
METVRVELDEPEEAEFVTATVDQLIDAITARPLDPERQGRSTYVTASPDWWVGGRTFGGMVVAQALSAALQSVPPELPVHSLHGYFMRPTPPGAQTLHVVEHLRDGRSFTSRTVTSSVEGKETFRATCSFHVPEGGDEYQMPVAPGLALPGQIEGVEAPFPFDVRELGPSARREDGTYESTRRCWFRTREALPDDPAVHVCLLAYFSDMTGAAFRPLSLHTFGTHTDASLDHAVWFHRPARADTWSLFDLQTLVNSGGRATVRATMHDAAGTLHLSMAQELLIRELDEPMVFTAPSWVERGSGDGAA